MIDAINYIIEKSLSAVNHDEHVDRYSEIELFWNRLWAQHGFNNQLDIGNCVARWRAVRGVSYLTVVDF